MGYYDDYVGNCAYTYIRRTKRKKIWCELVECFPKTIDAQSLGYGTANSYQTISVHLHIDIGKT